MGAAERAVERALVDAAMRHAVLLLQLGASEAREVRRLMIGAEVDLFRELRDALDRLSPERFTVRRLDALLRGVWEANESLYRRLADRSEEALREVVEFELSASASDFRSALQSVEGAPQVRAPALDQVVAAVRAQPLQGRLMGEWFDTLGAARQRRIQDALRRGYVEGKTVDDMVRDLRGTRAEGWQDGILNIDRRHAESVVRTATAHHAQQARSDFYAANSDLIEAERWVSTLDSRTTPECQVRDGKLYSADDQHTPIGHKVSWSGGPGALHWNCRSISVPVLQDIGLKLPAAAQRASVNGPVAAGESFVDWLERQPESFQRRVLGSYRTEQLRSGRITAAQLFDAQGRRLTVAELKAQL